MTCEPTRKRWIWLIAAAILLETLFLRMHSLYYLKNHAIGFVELALSAGTIYLFALYGFSRTQATRASTILLLLAAIVFRATLWPMEPTLSDDLQRYRWEAKIQAHGWNPYALAPRDPRLAGLRDKYYQIIPGREIPAIYPPVSELVFRATWKVFPGPTAFKTTFAAADVLVLLVLAWIFWRDRPDRDFRISVYAWNPLVIVEFAGSGHNDVLAVLGIVCGLAMVRKWPTLSNVPITLAAMAKVFPAVLVPVWIRRAGWPSKKGWWAVAIVFVTGFAVLAPYLSGIGMLRSNMTYYEATWKNYHASLYTLIDWLTGGKTRIPAIVVTLGAWGLAFWLAWKKVDPTRAAYLLIGTILALGPNGYSWYFTWIVPLLCFFPNPAWLMLTVLQFLSYNVLIGYGILGVFKFDPFLQALVYTPFYVLLITYWLYTRKRATHERVLDVQASEAVPER